MAWPRKRWWLGVPACLLALPLLAIGLAAAIIDPNDFKPQIAAAVRGATGRELTLAGPLRISRSLWPTIEVRDVRLANLPGGSRPDMARAEIIRAQLALLPLLWRRIEVRKLTLVGPNILFEEVGGRPNWAFGPTDPSPDPAPAGDRATTLRFRDVHVQNGMVTLRAPARTKVIGIRTLDQSHEADGGPLTIATVLVYGDNQPFSLRAIATPTAGLRDPWTTKLDFAALGAVATATGTMTLAGGYDLQLDATSGALEKLNALLPEMQLPPLHQVSLAAHLTNPAVVGDLPVVGAAKLHFDSADLGSLTPGLTLGPVDVTLQEAGSAASLAGGGAYRGQIIALAGSLGVPAHPDGRGTVPIDMRLEARKAGDTSKAAGNVAIKGRLGLDAGRFDGLDGQVALRTPALAGFRQVLSPLLPALTDVAFDGRLVLPADAASWRFSGIRFTAHEGALSGDLTVGPGEALVGHIGGQRLDVDAMLAAFGIADTPPKTGAGSGGPVIPDRDLGWAALRGPGVDLTAKIDALVFRQQNFHDLDLALRLRNGRLDVSRLAAGLAGGRLTVSLTADAAGTADLKLDGTGIPLAWLAHYGELPGTASGAVELDVKLRGAGRSLHDLAASLDGSVAATMVGGSVSNAAVLEVLASPLAALGITVPADGESVIHCAGLVGDFTKGVGRFRTIVLDTTYLELDGRGQVDLAAETVALKLHPLVRLSGSRVSVPVLVDGPFRAVRGRLDASGLDKLGLLIDAWFGGDRPATCADAGLKK